MFWECAIDVTNSKVKTELDKNENKRNSEALTIDDIMLNCETKDLSKSSYKNAH